MDNKGQAWNTVCGQISSKQDGKIIFITTAPAALHTDRIEASASHVKALAGNDVIQISDGTTVRFIDVGSILQVIFM